MNEKLTNSTVYKSVNDNQWRILKDIQELYLDGSDYECDPTYSKGNFYNNTAIPITPPRYRFDVEPQSEDVLPIQPLGQFPLGDESIKSIVIDLPFVVSQPDAPSLSRDAVVNGVHNNIIQRRFCSYYPKERLFESYFHFLSESYRVLKPGGVCVFKTQRIISASKVLMTPEMSWMFATGLGFYTQDRFTLVAKNRLISGKIKKQMHSRSFDSQFYVFTKPDGGSYLRPIDYFKWNK